MRASAETAGASTFAALKTRNYGLYWAGLVFYVLGHRAEYVTFAWIVWAMTQDPLFLAYLGLAQGVPLVVFQLFGGVLADRTNRLRLLIGTQILTAVTLTVAFGLTVLGLARVRHLDRAEGNAFADHLSADTFQNGPTFQPNPHPIGLLRNPIPALIKHPLRDLWKPIALRSRRDAQDLARQHVLQSVRRQPAFGSGPIRRPDFEPIAFP